jgi:cytochrome P450
VAAEDLYNRFIPNKIHLPTRDGNNAIQQLIEFSDFYVDKYLDYDMEELEKLTQGAGTAHVFLFEVLKYTRDRKYLNTQLMSLVAAARDTTTSSLTWILYYLSRHPEIFEKLGSEILSTFGAGTEDDIQALTVESVKKCNYLRNVISETMRLRPAVPINIRQAKVDTTLPLGGGKDGQSPLFVRKGTTMFLNMYYTYRRKDIWGEDALHYNPDRWHNLKTKPWSFSPFSGGPRACLGQQYAMTEIYYTIIRFCQTFERLELQNEDTQDFEEYLRAISVFPKDGLHLKVY